MPETFAPNAFFQTVKIIVAIVCILIFGVFGYMTNHRRLTLVHMGAMFLGLAFGAFVILFLVSTTQGLTLQEFAHNLRFTR